MAGVDILERNGEVHEEKIEVVDAPETELLLRKRVYLLTPVSMVLAASWGTVHTCSRAWKVFQSYDGGVLSNAMCICHDNTPWR